MRKYDDVGLKCVHMIRRRDDLHPSAFQDALLNVDVRAISRMPGLRQYGQHHALLQGYAKGDLVFDAFEEFWFEDVDAFERAKACDAWRTLHGAREGLIRPQESLFASVNISVQKDGVPPAHAIRSTEFVNRRPDLAMTEFRRYWLDSHGPLAAGIPQIIRYEQNHLDDREYAASPPRFDGWAATWFVSTAAMREAAQNPLYRETRLDEKNFLAGPLPVLFTRERLSLQTL